MDEPAAIALIEEVWTKERLDQMSEGALPHGLQVMGAEDRGVVLYARRKDDNFEFRNIPADQIPDEPRALVDKIDRELSAFVERAKELHPPEPLDD